jgi:multiple sugar transport system permease protein
MVGSKRVTAWDIALRAPFYLLALTVLAPYYWMVISAFKPVSELLRNPPTFWVQQPTLGNFYDPVAGGLFQLFRNAPLRFGSFFVNSLWITVTVTVLTLLLASAAAYVLAKHRIPFRTLIFIAIIASMMIPWQVLIIPNFLTVKNLGWINSYWALLIPPLPKAFAVFFLRQYMLSLPDDFIDAARIDGASEIRIWWQIILPLVRPALIAMAIFIGLADWNGLLWPLVVINDEAHGVLPLALARLSWSAEDPTSAGIVMAASLLASIPTLLFFLFFQRHFVEGISFGGLKG